MFSIFCYLLLAWWTPPTYHTYANARFGYQLDYPADLRPQPEADNGDGRRFVSADGQTVLTAYGSNLVLDGGLNEVRKIARQGWQKERATLTLDQALPTGYVLSGTVKSHIFYEKTVLRGTTLTTFSWEYPIARRAAMDEVIRHTIHTLRAGGVGGK
ncbi:hypothetical protein GCM10027422_27610 [Hymenobacter arcticus]